MIKKILGIGVPYGLENGLFYLGRIVVLSLVAMFEVLPGMAIGLGLTVVISRCVGAGNYEQARYCTKKLMGFVYAAHVVSCAAVLTLLPAILDVYGLSETVTALITKVVWYHAAFTVTI